MNQYSRLRSVEGVIARIFKSGNSLALRLPKELGFRPGEEIILTDHGDGTFSLRRANDKTASLDALYGAFSKGFMADGRGDIEQRERDWGPSTSGPTAG